MRKVLAVLTAAAAVFAAAATPAYATSVKPPYPPGVTSGDTVKPTPLPEIISDDTTKPVPLPEIIADDTVKPILLPWVRNSTIRILKAVVYTNALPCVVTESGKFRCERRTTISVRSAEERCWVTPPRLTVVSAVDGAVTVKLSGNSIRFTSRKCVNPTRAFAYTSVMFPVKSIIDYSTGQAVDVTRPITH